MGSDFDRGSGLLGRVDRLQGDLGEAFSAADASEQATGAFRRHDLALRMGVGEMRVTVVIASYRYGHLAAQAVDSVICQTRRADRVIFVDDGVGDCGHIPAIYPKVEFVARERTLGVVDNFREMLDRVRTGRVMFLGADNWLRPDALEILMAVDADIVSYDIALCGTEAGAFAALVGADEIREGYRIWRFSGGKIEEKNYIHGSSLYSVEMARDCGGYARSGNASPEEDWILWRRMLASGASHRHVPIPLLYYRRHRENSNALPMMRAAMARLGVALGRRVGIARPLSLAGHLRSRLLRLWRGAGRE